VDAIVNEPRIFIAKAAETLGDGDRLAEDAGFDSVGLLYLVMALEDCFGLEIDDAEAVSENFRTWGELLDYVEAGLA
jgi:acyl carrier protein